MISGCAIEITPEWDELECECSSCVDKLEIDQLKKLVDLQTYVIYDLNQRLLQLRAENFMEKNK